MMWLSRVNDVKVGDRVCFTWGYLARSKQAAGILPSAIGTVKSLTRQGASTIAEVAWGNPEIPAEVDAAHLVRASRLGINKRNC